jgi:hypothetical protein
MSKDLGKIIKYTIVPRNDNDDYDHNFKLSLTEFAKSLEGKSLLAPLIIYNSDLGIPMDIDESLEDYIIYTDKDDLLGVIRKQEINDVFRTLVIHGYDISLDEIRDIYCPIARRNNADLCINTIQDLELDSNLTFYLSDELDKVDDEEWEETKQTLEEEMLAYIEEYKLFEEMNEEEFNDMLPQFLNELLDLDGTSLIDMLDNSCKDRKKGNKKTEKDTKKIEEPKEIKQLPAPINTKTITEKKETLPMFKPITLSYECDGYVSLNKLEDDLYTIQDDDYEILLNEDQMDFVIEAYNRIKNKKLK